jgi:hypothetical protein
MHSTTIFASTLAFAASALAQVEGFAVMTAPARGEVVPAGETYTIVWSAGTYTGPVSVAILAGATPETLVLGEPIASGIDVAQGSYSWAVDCSLGEEATYGIKITSAGDESLFQYSFPFQIDNSACGADSESSAAPGYATSYSAYATSTPASYPASYPASSAAPSTVTSVPSNTTLIAPTTVPASSGFVSVTSGFANSTAYTTPTVTVSSTAETSASNPTGTGAAGSPSSTAVPTGAAGKTAGSIAMVGALAAFALAL